MRKQTIVIALLLLIALFSLQAAANWDMNGSQLTTSSSGTVYGGVYVSVGDNDDKTTTTPYKNHTSNYTLPDGIDVKWARLYVDVWCENENNTGWVNITFSGNSQSRWYYGKDDINPANNGSGHGVLWAWFDQTDNVTAGVNRVDVKSTIAGGDVFRAVLVCAYNDTDGCGHLVNYWVNDGNYNLHYDSGAGSTDSTTTSFNGAAYNATAGLDEVCCAKLTTVYHASGGGVGGTDAEPDYLYFNVIPTTTNHSPYYHRPNQLGDDGDTTYGDDDYADGPKSYWTMKSECVKSLLSPANNNATFWRGHNATNGPIYHNSTYTEPAGAEGEAFLHPMLAVLVVDPGTYATIGMVGGGVDNYFGLPLIDREPVTTALASIGPGPVYVLRYNTTSQSMETCILMNGATSGEFDMLDPVRGYIAKQTAAKTLTWTSK